MSLLPLLVALQLAFASGKYQTSVQDVTYNAMAGDGIVLPKFCASPWGYAMAMASDPSFPGMKPGRLNTLCMEDRSAGVIAAWDLGSRPASLKSMSDAVPRIKDAYSRQGFKGPRGVSEMPQRFIIIDQLLSHGKGVTEEAIEDYREIKFVPLPYLYVPGVRMIEFPRKKNFPWIFDFEWHTSAIKQEMLALAQGKDGMFGLFIHPDGGYKYQHPGWRTFHFVNQEGGFIEENARKAPRTWLLVQKVPRVVLNNMLMFSSLQPGAEIYEATGYTNIADSVHLPLMANDQSILQVGKEIRRWRESRAVVYNGAYAHRAWNAGSTSRVVLHFDVFHHDLSDSEVELLKPAYIHSQTQVDVAERQNMATMMEKARAVEQMGQPWIHM